MGAALPAFLSYGPGRPNFYGALKAAHVALASAIYVSFRYAEDRLVKHENPIPNKPPPTRMPIAAQRASKSITYVAAIRPAPSSRGKAPAVGGGGIGGFFRGLSELVLRPVNVAGHQSYLCFPSRLKKDAEDEFALG
ncbi:MAG: hypothetical protein KGI37_07090 [Alphaproteobacteria bacterium]|nr:hypothetical protein [Alphaproteobacteria bacterium]